VRAVFREIAPSQAQECRCPAKYLRHTQWFSLWVLRLASAYFVSPARRVFVNGVWGYQSGMSALTLLGDLQTLFRYHLREPLSDFPRPEQRNAFHSEPLLGDPHQLLERNFAGIAKELDQTRRFPQASPAGFEPSPKA